MAPVMIAVIRSAGMSGSGLGSFCPLTGSSPRSPCAGATATHSARWPTGRRSPGCLAAALRTLDRASQDVAGNERENNRVLPDGGIVAVLRKKVHQPGRGRGFPSFGPGRLDVQRPPARHRPGPSSIHHQDMIRTRVLVARVPRLPVDAYASSPGGDAAARCSNRIVRHRP
jgi:hypothetical protein